MYTCLNLYQHVEIMTGILIFYQRFMIDSAVAFPTAEAFNNRQQRLSTVVNDNKRSEVNRQPFTMYMLSE